MNRSILRVALCLLGIAGVSACGSQNDAIGGVDLDDNVVQRGGIFDTVISGTEGDAGWVFMFAEGETERNRDRIVGYALDQSAQLTGRFIGMAGSGNTRRASVLWFDKVLVTPEPDPDAEPDDPAPEPALQTRVRAAVLEIDIDPARSLSGQVVGDGLNVNLSGTYNRRHYERVSGVSRLAGIWENLDPFGGELLRLDFNSQGGFGGRDIEDCNYAGQVYEINRRYNLYAFELASACDEAVDATGLATIQPPPANPGATPRERLIAVVPARTNDAVYMIDVSRAVTP